MEEQMVKKSIESLTEEIIQLRASEIVYKTALDVTSDTNKELLAKIAKLNKKNMVKTMIIGGVGIYILAGKVKKFKKTKECKCPDFDDFDDDIFEREEN